MTAKEYLVSQLSDPYVEATSVQTQTALAAYAIRMYMGVDGDSMDDGTRNGFARKDLVLVRELQRDKWLPRLHYRDWPYWVVVFGNNVRIKQIIDQDDAGNITLHSLNPSPEYCDFTLNVDDISRLYNVVQHIPHPNIFK